MIIENRKLKKGQKLNLLACTHIGQPAVSWDGLSKFRKNIMSSGDAWIHLGDAIEAIIPGDKRFAHGEHEEPLLNQCETFVEWAKPIRKTCWGMLEGNHEQVASKTIGNLTKMMCKNAGIPFLAGACAIHIQAKKGTKTGFFAHGSGNINARVGPPERRYANMQVALRAKLQYFEGYLRAMAHMHTAIMAPPTSVNKLSFEGDGPKLRPTVHDDHWCIAAPSMFKTYDLSDRTNYGEAKLYRPNAIGWIELTFEDDATIPEARFIDQDGSVY